MRSNSRNMKSPFLTTRCHYQGVDLPILSLTVEMWNCHSCDTSSILLYEFYIKAGSMCLKMCYCNHYLMWLVLLLLCGHKWDGSFMRIVFTLLTMMNNMNLFGCLFSLFYLGSLVCNIVGLHNSLLFTLSSLHNGSLCTIAHSVYKSNI